MTKNSQGTTESRAFSRACISASALLSNLASIEGCLSPDQNFLSVVKANAYGHDMKLVTDVLKAHPRLAAFGVVTPQEAFDLAQFKTQKEVLLLGGYFSGDVLDLSEKNVIFSVHDLHDLATLMDAAKSRRVRLHLELETGMHRFGIPEKDLDRAIAMIQQGGDALSLEGAFTHFCNADVSASDYVNTQIERFQKMHATLETSLGQRIRPHLSNSASALHRTLPEYPWARTGLAVYGYDPYDNADARVSLTPALTWKAPVLSLKNVPKGESIGYGRGFVANRDLRIAILGVGYADGFRRSYQGNVEVAFLGRKCRTLGRVNMDLLAIDITDLPLPDALPEATILGPGDQGEMTARDIAEQTGLMPYEVLTQIGPRVRRQLAP